ncbi:MAG: type I CRISPR-associated protein Cas7 [Candidatus Heimdallarchaeum endolithica]|uniref:Type I CRISPR-associated protein Cas7 n=1 Tax=Candidatus Heimdallarchaeum endolithica TaxID=2876572 RepID=A0A9Y1FNI1_9ARCH|nr:MAG: type I CRISPR-associated protein Cas7 [Candidatus Heimdallarchaeum endolithica]
MTENQNYTKNNLFEKHASGLIIVKSVNSNFNADFSGTPRRLPDEKGTIYATDKSLKYCIRKYILDNEPSSKIFVWRRRNDNLDPMTIEENYYALFNSSKKNGKEDYKKIVKNLLSCIDVRMFGVTFTPKSNSNLSSLSITGPIQISYGINAIEENVHYINQILSPYRDDKEKQQAKHTTIGEESKALEIHYIFDFIVNPNTLKSNFILQKLEEKEQYLLSNSDVNIFKEAARLGVHNVNSTTKIGSETECFIYIEYDEPICLQNLKHFIDFENTKENGKTRIKINRLLDYIKENKKALSPNNTIKIEVYFDPAKTEIEKGRISEETEHITLELKNLLTGHNLNS